MTNPPYGSGDGDTPDLNKNPQPPSYGGPTGDSYGYGDQSAQPAYGQSDYGTPPPAYGQPGYGAPPPAYGPGYGPKPKGLAIASMVCGIVSIVLWCIPYLTLPLGIAAVVTGVLANKKVRLGEADGAGMAKAGLITGIIGIVIAVLIFILALIGYSLDASDFN